jgi:Family of unknown function (DUF5752)
MNLSPVRHEILEHLLLHEMPTKAAQIANELGIDARATQMHLIGLVRMGLAENPSKGQYQISVKGKQTLGLPEITREKALEILRQTHSDKAFHFYDGIGKPLNVYACDLLDFCDKITKVSVESVNFHFERGDFEAWFKSLGDLELAKRIAQQKRLKTKGEELRDKILSIVKNRFLELSEKAGRSAPAS